MCLVVGDRLELYNFLAFECHFARTLRMQADSIQSLKAISLPLPWSNLGPEALLADWIKSAHLLCLNQTALSTLSLSAQGLRDFAFWCDNQYDCDVTRTRARTQAGTSSWWTFAHRKNLPHWKLVRILLHIKLERDNVQCNSTWRHEVFKTIGNWEPCLVVVPQELKSMGEYQNLVLCLTSQVDNTTLHSGCTKDQQMSRIEAIQTISRQTEAESEDINKRMFWVLSPINFPVQFPFRFALAFHSSRRKIRFQRWVICQ